MDGLVCSDDSVVVDLTTVSRACKAANGRDQRQAKMRQDAHIRLRKPEPRAFCQVAVQSAGIWRNSSASRQARATKHRIRGAHTMQIEVDELPSLRLATIAHVGPYNLIGKAFEQLGMIAGRAGLFAHPGAMMMAVYDDDPDGKPADELRSHAGISIPEPVPIPDGTVEQRIAAGAYARYSHVGPYEKLADVWSRFVREALAASGYTLVKGPAIEIYRSDMRTTPKEKLRTDLLLRVERR
jgi:AraC family transcriptional regulator